MLVSLKTGNGKLQPQFTETECKSFMTNEHKLRAEENEFKSNDVQVHLRWRRDDESPFDKLISEILHSCERVQGD